MKLKMLMKLKTETRLEAHHFQLCSELRYEAMVTFRIVYSHCGLLSHNGRVFCKRVSKGGVILTVNS